MIPEPSCDLWTWLQKFSDAYIWPRTDEDAAQRMGDNWHQVQLAMQQTIDAASAQNDQIPAVWKDASGVLYNRNLTANLGAAGYGSAADSFGQVAAMCWDLARTVAQVKDQIYSELIMNAIFFAATFLMPPGIGDFFRWRIVASLAERFSTLIRGAAGLLEHAGLELTVPQALKQLGGELLREGIEEGATEIIGQQLDIQRGFRPEGLNWQQVAVSSGAGIIGEPLGRGLNRVGRVGSAPAGRLADAMRLGDRGKLVMQQTGHAFVVNGISSPISSTAAQSIADGNFWQTLANPGQYANAVVTGGFTAGVLGASRIGTVHLGDHLGQKWSGALREFRGMPPYTPPADPHGPTPTSSTPNPVTDPTTNAAGAATHAPSSAGAAGSSASSSPGSLGAGHGSSGASSSSESNSLSGAGRSMGGAHGSASENTNHHAPTQRGSQSEDSNDQRRQAEQPHEAVDQEQEQVGATTPQAAAQPTADAQPTTTQFGTTQSPSGQPTVGQSTTSQPTAAQAPAAQPTATQPTATQPTPTQSTATQSTATQSTAAQPGGTQPTASQPTGAQPAGSQPTAQSAATQSASNGAQATSPADAKGNKPANPEGESGPEFADLSTVDFIPDTARLHTDTSAAAAQAPALAQPTATAQPAETPAPVSRPRPTLTRSTTPPSGPQNPIDTIEVTPQEGQSVQLAALEAFTRALNERAADGTLTSAALALRARFYKAPDISRDTGEPTGVVQRHPDHRSFKAATSDGSVVDVQVPSLRYLTASNDFGPVQVVPAVKKPGPPTEVRLDDPRLGRTLEQQRAYQHEVDHWNASKEAPPRPKRPRTKANEPIVMTPAEAEALQKELPTPQVAGWRLGESFADALLGWLGARDPGVEEVHRVFADEYAGSGRFDKIYVRIERGTGRILGFVIGEAKSVDGALGPRRGANDLSYEQGHPEYIRSILEAMTRRGGATAVLDNDVRAEPATPRELGQGPNAGPRRPQLAVPLDNETQLAEAMRAALDAGQVEFFVAKPLLEGGHEAVGVTITEYDVSSPQPTIEDHGEHGTARSNQDMVDNGGGLERTAETVAEIAAAAAVDLSGIDVVIVSDPEEIRYFDQYGVSATATQQSDGSVQIRLGPASFADRETLAATLAHEKTHADQFRAGVPVEDENIPELENEAYASESPALERLRVHDRDQVHDRDDVRPGEPGRDPDTGRAGERGDPGRHGPPDRGHGPERPGAGRGTPLFRRIGSGDQQGDAHDGPEGRSDAPAGDGSRQPQLTNSGTPTWGRNEVVVGEHGGTVLRIREIHPQPDDVGQRAAGLGRLVVAGRVPGWAFFQGAAAESVFPADAQVPWHAFVRLEQAVEHAVRRGLEVDLIFAANPETKWLEATIRVTDPVGGESVTYRRSGIDELADRLRPTVDRAAVPQPAPPKPVRPLPNRPLGQDDAVDGGPVSTPEGRRITRWFGGNQVTRPAGPLSVGQSVVADLRSVVPDPEPAIAQRQAELAARRGTPLHDGRPVGGRLFGNAGLRALGVAVDPVAFAHLEEHLATLLDAGDQAVLSITRIPRPSSDASSYRYTVETTAPDGTRITYAATDLSALNTALENGVPTQSMTVVEQAATAAPVVQQPSPLQLPVPSGTRVERLVAEALARASVARSGGVEGIQRIAANRYAIYLSDRTVIQAVIGTGSLATSESYAFEVRPAEQLAVVTLSTKLRGYDVAPTMAQIIAELRLRFTAARTNPDLLTRDPVLDPQRTQDGREDLELTVHDQSRLANLEQRVADRREMGPVTKARTRDALARLIESMGLATHQRDAELLRGLIDGRARAMVQVFEAEQSLLDRRLPTAAFVARSVVSSGISSAAIAAAVDLAGQSTTLAIGLAVPAFVNSLAGAFLDRWLAGKKEPMYKPAYQADDRIRERDYPGMRALLGVKSPDAPTGPPPARATRQSHYVVRHGSAAVAGVAAAVVLMPLGVDPIQAVTILGLSGGFRAITERLVDKGRFGSRLRRVDHLKRSQDSDPDTLQNQLLAVLSDLQGRAERLVALQNPEQPRRVPELGEKPGFPSLGLFATVQAIDNTPSILRRALAGGSTSAELLAQITTLQGLAGVLGPSLIGGVVGAPIDAWFMGRDEAAGDARRTHEVGALAARLAQEVLGALGNQLPELATRIQQLEVQAGLREAGPAHLADRTDDRTALLHAPEAPAGARPFGLAPYWVWFAQTGVASAAAIAGTIGLDIAFDLSDLSLWLSITGGVGAAIGVPVSRYFFKRAELLRFDRLNLALSAGVVNPAQLDKLLARVQYVMEEIGSLADQAEQGTPQLAGPIDHSAPDFTDRVRAAVRVARVANLPATAANRETSLDVRKARSAALQRIEAMAAAADWLAVNGRSAAELDAAHIRIEQAITGYLLLMQEDGRPPIFPSLESVDPTTGSPVTGGHTNRVRAAVDEARRLLRAEPGPDKPLLEERIEALWAIRKAADRVDTWTAASARLDNPRPRAQAEQQLAEAIQHFHDLSTQAAIPDPLLIARPTPAPSTPDPTHTTGSTPVEAEQSSARRDPNLPGRHRERDLSGAGGRHRVADDTTDPTQPPRGRPENLPGRRRQRDLNSDGGRHRWAEEGPERAVDPQPVIGPQEHTAEAGPVDVREVVAGVVVRVLAGSLLLQDGAVRGSLGGQQVVVPAQVLDGIVRELAGRSGLTRTGVESEARSLLAAHLGELTPESRAETAEDVLRAAARRVAAEEIAQRARQLDPSQEVAEQAQSGEVGPGTDEMGGDGATTHAPEVGRRFVTDGRGPAEGPLTVDRVVAAVAETVAADFGGLVTSLRVSGELVIVEAPGFAAPQVFRVEVATVRRGKVASTTAHPGGAHVVRFSLGVADSQLARVWVHEISHTLQELRSPSGGPIRRLWARLTGGGPNPCVDAQYNEFRYLQRRWYAAPSNELSEDLEALVNAIEGRKHTPPILPWNAPPAFNPRNELRAAIADQVQALNYTVDAVRALIQAKHQAADEAIKAQRESIEKAAEEAKDNAATARRGAAEAEAKKQADLAAWHQRLEAKYESLLAKLTATRDAYQRLDVDSQDLATEATRLATEVASYQEAMKELAPPEAAFPSMQPTGRLPHLTALTERINAVLAAGNIDQTFTATELQQLLSAEFGRVIADQGAVLRVGNEQSAELRVKLSVDELVEVRDPKVKASETINGLFPQAGRRLATTATSRFGTAFTVPMKAILQLLATATHQPWLGDLTLNGELSTGRSRAVTGNAAEYAQTGAVEDNRGESVLYSSKAAWNVDLRTDRAQGWSAAETVAEGNSQDATELRAWVSHAYTVDAVRDTDQRPDLATGRLPAHLLTSVTGLEQLTDNVIDVNEESLAKLGADRGQVEDQIHAALTNDLPSRLTESTDHAVLRPLTVDGKPVGHLEVTTTIRYEHVELIGAQSNTHWQESVRIGFSSTSTQQTFVASTSVSAKTGYDGAGVQDIDPSGTDVGPTVSGGRSASRSESLSGGGTSIHVGVHRFTGPTQAYQMVLEHSVTVVLDGKVSPAVDGKSTVVARVRVKDAYRYGLPVDRTAVHDGGRTVDGEVVPNAVVPGRKLELPAWATDDAGRLNAAGPWNVQAVTGGKAAFEAIMQRLADRGFVPPMDANSNPDFTKLSTDPVERHAQLLNLEELREQLSTERLEAGYDLAARDGILVTLTRSHTAQPTETVVLRIGIEQHSAKSLGVTDNESVVLLNIGSETASRSGTRTKAWPWRADPFAVRSTTGLDAKAGLSYGRQALGRVLAWFTGGTVNQVTLVESTSPVAVFEVQHTLTVAELTADGEQTFHTSSPGESARVLIDSDLLPYDDVLPATALTGPVQKSVLDRMTLLALGAAEFTAKLPKAIKDEATALQQLGVFLNPRNLLAHPEWTSAGYRTTLLVPGLAGISRRIAVTLTGRLQNPQLVAVTEGVSGDINLALSNHGMASGRSYGGSTEASAGLSENSAGGGFNASLGTSGSTSNSDQDIWGVERLTIETGRHYVFTADADVSLAVGNHTPESTTVGTVFQLAERDALRFYAQNELALPLQQVADAVERFLHGNLSLDRRSAAGLVRRYRAELTAAHAAGTPVPALSAEHTAQALAAKLRPSPRPIAESSEQRLDQILQEQPPARIDLPAHHQEHLGFSLIESISSATDPLTEVYDVLRSESGVDPLQDPVLAQSLFVDLAGKRWWGRLEDMLGASGFVRSYSVGRPGQLSADQLTVRIRAEFVDDARELGEAKDVVGIVQRYLYGDRSHASSSGRSTGMGVNGAIDGTHSGSASTDRSEGTSTSVGDQVTRLERIAGFDGMTRVGRTLRLRIEVSHDSAAATRGPLGRRVTPESSVATAERELTGEVVQLIPTAALGKTVPSMPVVPGEVELPSLYHVEGVGPANGRADLFDAVVDELAAKDLLGPDGVRVHLAELENKLSASARNAQFSRMASEEGFTLAPLEVPGSKQDAVQVTIRARVSTVEVVTAPFAGELGEVNRHQGTVSTTTSTGRLLPTTTSGTYAALDASGSASTGDQVADATTDLRGARTERSHFEKGNLVTIRVRVAYDLTITRTRQTAGGSARERSTTQIPAATTGRAYLTIHEHDYNVLTNSSPTPTTPLAPPPAAPSPGSTDSPTQPVPSRWKPINTGAPALLAFQRAQRKAENQRRSP